MSRPPSPDRGSSVDGALDRLLGQAPFPKPDGWFTARTLARCRHSASPAESGWMLRGLGRRWAFGAFALCLAAFALQQVRHSEKLSYHRQRNVQEAFEIVASLDTDPDPSSTWPDSSL